MKEKYNIVELFSGIGSQARALKNIGIQINVQATCEWDIHAFIAYDAMHESIYNLPEVEKMSKEELLHELESYNLSNNGKEPMAKNTLHGYSDAVLKRVLSAIRRTRNFVDISKVKGESMPGDADILTYSFPCQDLSNVGAFHGYNKGIEEGSGSRSSLLWQVGRILREMKQSGKKLPRYLIMENVPTLLSPRHKENFEKWIGDLADLGYISKYVLVNARNYGIPQNRPRLLMMSIFVGDNKRLRSRAEKFFLSWGDDEAKIIDDYKQSPYYKPVGIKDLLRCTDDRSSVLWKEALECTPNNTPSRRRIWNENPKIIDEQGKITDEEFIRTITTKQDRNPNSGNIYFNTGEEGRGTFRYLTPRECLLFMGFTDKDYDNLQANNPPTRGTVAGCDNGESTADNGGREIRCRLFPRDKIIRMAGNSIPVKMLEGFFYQLYKTEKFMGKK